MRSGGQRSIASDGRQLTFYWRNAASAHHVDEAVEALLGTIRRPERHLTVYAEENVRANFREELILAEEGALTPGTAVKRIQSRPDIFMYEIRWIDIPVTPIVDQVSSLFGDQEFVHVRLYYIEQGTGRWILGLHAHEKRFGANDEETEAWQNQEIDIACELLRQGAATWCGVAEIGHETGGSPLLS